MTFPKYDIGSYPLFYIAEYECLCADCCTQLLEDGDDRLTPIDGSDADYNEALSCHINYENAHLYCDECGDRIESAYNEDEHAND